VTWLSDIAVARLREVADSPDLSGTRYTIVREIARGGMGVIYEAHDRELQRSVALKVLAPEIAGVEAIERMKREAVTIARLEHPGIIPVHDAGILPDGRAFYAMKLVRGVTLAEFAREHSATEVLRVFLRVCEAVAFAHAHDVVHRDLKPDNIMVGAFGETLVMDWGVARTSEEEEKAAVIGTRGYMSPEQERGESSRTDSRSDVFALGRILSGLASPRSKPLKSIVARATASDPTLRYANAKELGEEIVRYLDGEPVRAHREGPLDAATRLVSRHRALVAMLLAYLIMRAVILLWARI
jgi:eukaryotic-like serine/threonine-protein kinase